MLFKVFAASLILFPSLVYSKNLTVVTTIKPLQSIVQNIVGNSTQVDLLVTKSNSPHFYALKPSDLKKIHAADLIFFIDKNFEVFLSKFIESNKNKFINLSNNDALTLYKNRDSEFWNIKSAVEDKHNHLDTSGNEHKHDSPLAHNHDNKVHDHTHEGQGHAMHTHSSNQTDYHLWLDTDNVKAMAKHIFKVLVSYNPIDEALYTKNLNLFLSKLDILESEISKNLNSLKNKKFIVFHDAYQYLDRKYNLSPSGVVLINPMRKATIKELSLLINKIKSQNIKCLFSEPQFPQAVINLIIENTHINVAILDAEWGIDNNNTPNSEAYFYMMRKIVANMNICLN